MPSAKNGSAAWATSIASRLLPMPPGPSTVTSRSSPARRRWSSSSTSRVRPISAVYGAGVRPARCRALSPAARPRAGSRRTARRAASRGRRRAGRRVPRGWRSDLYEARVVGPDPVDEVGQSRLALGGRLLQVDELGHAVGSEPVLVLQPRDLVVGRDPAVALGVQADEHLALLEVRPVEILGRMRPGAELEHHRRQSQLLDRRSRGTTFVGELVQGGAHEHPQPLVGRADRIAPVHSRGEEAMGHSPRAGAPVSNRERGTFPSGCRELRSSVRRERDHGCRCRSRGATPVLAGGPSLA